MRIEPKTVVPIENHCFEVQLYQPLKIKVPISCPFSDKFANNNNNNRKYVSERHQTFRVSLFSTAEENNEAGQEIDENLTDLLMNRLGINSNITKDDKITAFYMKGSLLKLLNDLVLDFLPFKF